MKRIFNDYIILIGTAHVSKKSVAEVESAISKYQPDIIAVELDDKRYLAITKKNRWEKTSIVEVIRSGKGFLLLVQTFLAMIQRKLGKEFGVEPGAEMVAAIKTAKKYGLDVALVDRDITITFKRAWKLMSIREKLRLFWYSVKALVGYDRIEEELENELEAELDRVVGKKKKKDIEDKSRKDNTTKSSASREAALERLMDEDVISAMMEELRQVVPNATKALIDERDQYISKKILGYVDGTETKFIKYKKKSLVNKKPSGKDQMSKIKQKAPEKLKSLNEEGIVEDKTSQVELKKPKKITKTPKKRVLAVVGAGHLSGIKKNLKKPQKLPKLKSLETVPVKRISLLKTIGYLIPILFFALFAYLVIYGEWEKLKEVLWIWFIVNGICSAIGALLAFGHPLSILTAFFAAPITSLNPAIGAGWVAGYVEVKVRTPTVKDIQNMSAIETMKDFFKNRVVRVLMVMALSNLGSMVGTFLAWYLIGKTVIF